MNEEINISEKKKLTNNIGAPVADNQNLITAGPGFCAQKMVRRSSNDPSSLLLLPKSIDTSTKIN
jgi:hypothetical protein